MIGLKGPAPSKEERDFISFNNIAGVLLFKRNIQSLEQVHRLCLELKALTDPPVLIALDMEGGEVDRFSHLKESSPWPSPQKLKTRPVEQIYRTARALARSLYLLGIDVNFAPVVDLPVVENPLLKTRVFGKSKLEILKNAEPFVKGMIKGCLIPCLKHFPGHGGVAEDSHKTLPKDPRSLKELKPQLEIFQNLFKKHLCWIMTAHVEFPHIEKTPATFSQLILTDQLKSQMGFEGILTSDDMDMSAVQNFSAGERFFHALKGGCDLILTGQNPKSPIDMIRYFQIHPEKKEEIKKELYQASEKLLNIRQKSTRIFPNFKTVKKELSKIQLPDFV